MASSRAAGLRNSQGPTPPADDSALLDVDIPMSCELVSAKTLMASASDDELLQKFDTCAAGSSGLHATRGT